MFFNLDPSAEVLSPPSTLASHSCSEAPHPSAFITPRTFDPHTLTLPSSLVLPPAYQLMVTHRNLTSSSDAFPANTSGISVACTVQGLFLTFVRAKSVGFSLSPLQVVRTPGSKEQPLPGTHWSQGRGKRDGGSRQCLFSLLCRKGCVLTTHSGAFHSL